MNLKQRILLPSSRSIIIVFFVCISITFSSCKLFGFTVDRRDNIQIQQLQQEANLIYQQIDFCHFAKINPTVFATAFVGFHQLKSARKIEQGNNILSICDFSLSSNVPRLWVIDLQSRKVLYNTLVAHGQGTGEEYAVHFSNRNNSHQSSLGFYITDTTYDGDNGYSLRLLGMDKGYNDKALDRAIVMHGATYVSEDFIKNNQRLGRSWGCPAIPTSMAKPIINKIKNGSCLFIYFPDSRYLNHSKWL